MSFIYFLRKSSFYNRAQRIFSLHKKKLSMSLNSQIELLVHSMLVVSLLKERDISNNTHHFITENINFTLI